MDARKRLVVAAAATLSLMAAAGCAGAGAGGDDRRSISVLMVGNPQMEDIRTLVPDTFTRDTGIEVDFTILPENELRDRVTQDVANGAGQYDLVTIGAYETPIWAQNGWLNELGPYADADAAFDRDDLLEPIVDSLSLDGNGGLGGLYALPFYGESSFLMYRKDVFADLGLEVPERPTWDQVAALAAKADGSRPGMRGICLRGLPGWGELFAPLTTVVNTFGGTWFDADWRAAVNSPDFVRATQFYVDLVRKHGPEGAAQSGFTECLTAMSQGRVAMWYDATVAAGTLEDPGSSTVAGKVGYAFAPVARTRSSGWLWTWAWAMPRTTRKADDAARFALWASGKDYERLAGERLGWSRVPAGKRASTYAIPEYRSAASAFGPMTLAAIREARPGDPGLQARPTIGVQFVAIPEFAELGTTVSQAVSAAIAGRGTVSDALKKGQQQAEEIAPIYRQ